MSLLTFSHIVIFLGVLLAALGGFGAYYFGKQEAGKKWLPRKEYGKIEDNL